MQNTWNTTMQRPVYYCKVRARSRTTLLGMHIPVHIRGLALQYKYRANMHVEYLEHSHAEASVLQRGARLI